MTTEERITWICGPEFRDEHRKQFTDMEWAAIQHKGPPKYKIGDVVEFMVGGFGVIDGVSEPHGGWPSKYSTNRIPGMPAHKRGVSAWHFDGDFKRLVAKSPLHDLPNDKVRHGGKAHE